MALHTDLTILSRLAVALAKARAADLHTVGSQRGLLSDVDTPSSVRPRLAAGGSSTGASSHVHAQRLIGPWQRQADH